MIIDLAIYFNVLFHLSMFSSGPLVEFKCEKIKDPKVISNYRYTCVKYREARCWSDRDSYKVRCYDI